MNYRPMMPPSFLVIITVAELGRAEAAITVVGRQMP
jgi:hypothetical protein